MSVRVPEMHRDHSPAEQYRQAQESALGPGLIPTSPAGAHEKLSTGLERQVRSAPRSQVSFSPQSQEASPAQSSICEDTQVLGDAARGRGPIHSFRP